jgi:UDP-N-acetylmuramoylalanine--D-glutamate ligase
VTELPGRALVVGLARSGQAAALALTRRGVEVVGVDRSPDVDPGRLGQAGVEVRLGTEEEWLLDGVDLVIKSPGVPGGSPLVAAARRRGLPVWSEVELGYRLLSAPVLGVTGTNGKTTTCELLAAIFRAAGRQAILAGNEQAAQLSDLDGALAGDAWIVCELSSFQLEDTHELRPRIAVLVNLEPDHLDRHGSVEAYRQAKLRIFENQREDDTAVVPRGFGPVPGAARRVEFHVSDPLPAEPLLPGAHNRENAAAATAAARAAEIGDDAIARALESFRGVRHRLELVGELGGVRFVNDSKATNTAAAVRALTAYEAPLRVILGGSLKGERFDGLAAALGPHVRRAYLIGEAAEQLARALDRLGVPYERSGDLRTAVRSASAAAGPGEVVLLSPACASYDQFANFQERGETFRRLVEELAP